MIVNFTLSDCCGGSTRKVIVENVSDISEAFSKLDDYIHDDEYIYNYEVIEND